MQLTGRTAEQAPSNVARKLRWFFAAPVFGAVLMIILAALLIVGYEERHEDRIYTGVMVWGQDLSGLNRSEARSALENIFPYPEEQTITLLDSKTGRQWVRSPADFGVGFDVNLTVDAAFLVGREGSPFRRLDSQFQSWYLGQHLAPIVVFDEARLYEEVREIAAEIDQAPLDATLGFDGSSVGYSAAQVGRRLDVTDTIERLMVPINDFRQAEIELLIHETTPRIGDTSATAGLLENILSAPMTLYLQKPLSGVDLNQIVVPVEEIVKWVRIITVEGEEGQATTEVLLDENAIRAYLGVYAEQIRLEPLNARFYFDDDTRELVLVEDHVSGRELDLEATAQQFIEQVKSPDHMMPLVLREIVPAVHSGVRAADLSITELVSESTTWFYGSSDERKHNIARAASNFYGIVVAPGEEFSFNQYLGDVSAETGYESGLIIFGGRTIEGVGGGVCQVSTTAFQAAFWAGYPITERWEHGYQVGYYDDGEGPGMDATVFSPLVDLRFINDTPHYLLIENYYNEANSSLTFKFYSTSLGRTVTKDGPEIANITPPKPDIWELNEELETGEIEQVDWAVEGADVTVGRSVFNANGELIRQDTFVSHYIPWQNIYQYGPGTNLPTPTPTPEPTGQTPEPADGTPTPGSPGN